MKSNRRVVHRVPARQFTELLNRPDESGFEMRIIEHQLYAKERLTRQAGRVLATVLLIGLATFLAASVHVVTVGPAARGVMLLVFPFALIVLTIYFLFLTWQILVMNRRLSGIILSRRTRNRTRRTTTRQKKPFAYLLRQNNGLLGAVWLGLAVVLALLVADAVILWNTNLTGCVVLLPRLSLLRLDPIAALVFLKIGSIALSFLFFLVVVFLWFRQTIVYFWGDEGVAWRK